MSIGVLDGGVYIISAVPAPASMRHSASDECIAPRYHVSRKFCPADPPGTPQYATAPSPPDHAHLSAVVRTGSCTGVACSPTRAKSRSSPRVDWLQRSASAPVFGEVRIRMTRPGVGPRRRLSTPSFIISYAYPGTSSAAACTRKVRPSSVTVGRQLKTAEPRSVFCFRPSHSALTTAPPPASATVYRSAPETGCALKLTMFFARYEPRSIVADDEALEESVLVEMVPAKVVILPKVSIERSKTCPFSLMSAS